MPGLIGSMIAGGVAGAGEGAGKAAQQWTANLMEQEKQKAIAEREMNLARYNRGTVSADTQATTTTQKDIAATHEAGATTRTGAEIASHEREGGLNRQMQETLQNARIAYDSERDAAQRDLTREEIKSREKIAANNNSVALQVARIGGTVQQDKDGNLLFFDKSGRATQIMDPNNPGKPLVGYKDLTPAAKTYSDVIKEQLKGLDREEVAATGDAAAIAKIGERRADLNTNLLNVLTGGISSAGKSSAAPTITDPFKTQPGARGTGNAPKAAVPATEQPPVPGLTVAEPGSPAARFQTRQASEKAATQAAKEQAQSQFDRDVETMSPQQLYDTYDALLGKLTPLQLSRYQNVIRTVK